MIEFSPRQTIMLKNFFFKSPTIRSPEFFQIKAPNINGLGATKLKVMYSRTIYYTVFIRYISLKCSLFRKIIQRYLSNPFTDLSQTIVFKKQGVEAVIIKELGKARSNQVKCNVFANHLSTVFTLHQSQMQCFQEDFLEIFK